jgi:hypothetical protein
MREILTSNFGPQASYHEIYVIFLGSSNQAPYSIPRLVPSTFFRFPESHLSIRHYVTKGIDEVSLNKSKGSLLPSFMITRITEGTLHYMYM